MHTLFRPVFSEIHPPDLHFRGYERERKKPSCPITTYEKNQLVYPAGHPGHYSSLSLCFWLQGRLLQSCSSRSCLTSSAVVLSWEGRCFPIHFLSSDFREQCRFFSLSQSLFCPDTRELHSSFVLQLCLKLMHHQMRFATTSPQLQCGESRWRCGNIPLQHQGLAKTLLQVQSEHPGTFDPHSKYINSATAKICQTTGEGMCMGTVGVLQLQRLWWPHAAPQLCSMLEVGGERAAPGLGAAGAPRTMQPLFRVSSDRIATTSFQGCIQALSITGIKTALQRGETREQIQQCPQIQECTRAWATQNCQSSVSENEVGQWLVPIYMGLLQN